ncbi:hypothetical protein GCM10011584_35330 [Nocardioides phosphati]|uniref:Restriction endonuclease type IV Mrr domain-containing protein n=1 Tax=Nocardioides phosphati TaxID=1867775 RepID=A0ABQ2NJW8_9ACTN|nr:restriction endonuclease [Nocardioides phosphati]GGO94396.1 hypothetical protein GCM10011584_35330 [Nocardioides phosphati]
MLNLAKDKRTARAYYDTCRDVAASRVLPVPPTGVPVDRLLGTLGKREETVFVGAAYDVVDAGTAEWWLVALTGERLVCAAWDGSPRVWSALRGDWASEDHPGSVVLRIAHYARPLAVVGAGRLREGFRGARPAAVATPSVAPASTEAVAGETSEIATNAVEVSTWQGAETLAATHMRHLGFQDVHQTPEGADGGVDVRASTAVAQVKHYASPVGAPMVQQLRGAAHGQDWALFYALSGYTAKAVEFAASSHVALFTYTADGHVAPVNEAARYLVERAGEEFDPSQFSAEEDLRARAKAAFDDALARFLDTAQRALAFSQTIPNGRALRAGLQSENERLMARIQHWKAQDRLPLIEYLDGVEEILSATRRLNEDVERYRR